MNDLFIILGIIIFFIGVMLIWIAKRHRSRDMAERSGNGIEDTDFFTDDYFDDDDQLLQPASTNKPDPLFDTTPFTDDLNNESADSLIEREPEGEHKETHKKTDMLIVLYVVALQKTGFKGQDILAILEELGVKYGEMKIFHHYGVGELKVEEPVFSVANMVEPGIFNPQEMLLEFSTPGLALFMHLPGPFGGRVAFELMLNSAQRIANVLDGYLEDEKRTELDQQKISDLREKIANFEQRSTSLSMLQRFS